VLRDRPQGVRVADALDGGHRHLGRSLAHRDGPQDAGVLDARERRQADRRISGAADDPGARSLPSVRAPPRGRSRGAPPGDGRSSARL
jgi:hypothetical protein